MYNEYKMSGISPSTDVKEGRLDKDGDVIDTIKIFKPKPSQPPSSTAPNPKSSEGLEINLLTNSFFVTPTKTVVGADLNFANVSEGTLGISAIDLPYVAEVINVATDDTPLEVQVIPDGENISEMLPPTSTPTPVNQSVVGAQVLLEHSVPITSPANGENILEMPPPTSTPMPVNQSAVGQQVLLQHSVPITSPVNHNADIVPLNSNPLPVAVQSAEISGMATVASSRGPGHRDTVRKLVAKKIKFKQEQKASDKPVKVVQCLVCNHRKLKKDAKWKWKSCLQCENEVHTLCVGMSKTDKVSTFTCDSCMASKE